MKGFCLFVGFRGEEIIQIPLKVGDANFVERDDPLGAVIDEIAVVTGEDDCALVILESPA